MLLRWLRRFTVYRVRSQVAKDATMVEGRIRASDWGLDRIYLRV